MRVLQVIEALTVGGAERLIVELSRELFRRGVDSSVLCLSQPGSWATPLMNEGLYAGCLFKKRGADFGVLRALRERIEHISPDIVHSHLFTANLWTRLAGLPRRRFGLLVTLHNVDSWRGPVHRIADRVLADAADRYVAVSASVYDYYRRRGHGIKRLRKIPNGIASNHVKTVDPFRRAAPLVRACGRLVPQKGFETLIKAAAILAADKRDFTVEIIGEGPERPRLTKLIRRAGVEGRVALLGERDNARELIAEGDVFVLPSYREGLPLVLLEALHAGRPVVASNLAGLQGVVEDTQEALLVKPGSAEELASAVAGLLDDTDAARAMGRRGRARAVGEFSIERTAAAYLEVYGEVMGERVR